MRLGNVNLQPKEVAVAQLVTAGEKNCDIAKILGTTHNVVRNYVRHIMDQTGMSNRVELALWVMKNNYSVLS